MKSQAEATGISTFLEKSSEYSRETFKELNLADLFNETVQGKLHIKGLFGLIINLCGKELKNAVSSMISILIIIVIHSILKTIIENLGNDSTARNCLFYRIFNYSYFDNKHICKYVEFSKKHNNKYCKFYEFTCTALNYSNSYNRPYCIRKYCSVGTYFRY